MEDSPSKRARRLMHEGLRSISQNDFQGARDKFKASAEATPSADAFTYWAWMEHHLGNTALAIDLCHQAIALDPDFGNPYNDIGSYLISQGDLDGAIPWLERAMRATRYEPRHFPHINLARVYLAKQMPLKALAEFNKALAFVPNDSELQETIRKIELSIC